MAAEYVRVFTALYLLQVTFGMRSHTHMLYGVSLV